MKKLLWLMLIAVLAMGLAACGAAPAAAPDQAQEAAAGAEAEAAEAADEAEEAPPAEPAESEAEPMAGGIPATTDFGDVDTTNCDAGYEGETIVIYQQAGLTGPLATILGEGFINGTKDAVTQINADGGVCGATLEIRLEDTQYDPEQELAVYEQFRAEDPPPIMTLSYGSGATIILKDRVVEDKIVNLAAGLNAEAFYDPADGYTVGVGPIYSDQFAGFLQWAHDNWADIKPEGAGDDIVVGVVGWANAFGAGATTPEALAFAESLGITVLPLEEQEIAPTADVTGQVQNLLVNGANVIYIQSLSFGPAQVIGTVRALGFWDQVIVGGVNWSMNQDVLNILGENAALAEGFYGVVPSYWWNDTDNPGVQSALAAFEAGGYDAANQDVGYLLSYGEMFAIKDVLQHTINLHGYENLSGETFMDAMKDLGVVSAAGLFELDVRDGNRAPRQASIRQAQAVDGTVQFMPVADFFELPDTRPGQ